MNTIGARQHFLRTLTTATRGLPGAYLLAEWLRKQYASSEVEVLLSDFDKDLRMYVNLADHIGGQIFWHGHYSVDQLRLANKLISATDVVLDVGANIGEFSLFVAKRIPHGALHAFEPAKKSFAIAKRNLQVNQFDNATVHNFGFSDQPARLDLYKASGKGADGAVNNGLNTLFPTQGIDIAETIEVVRMDDWCEQSALQKIDLIKMDIEGAELFALKGAQQTLRKFRPKLVVEVNEVACVRAGYSPLDLVEFIANQDYEIHNIHKGGEISSASDFASVTRDVLCLPK